MIRSSTLQYLYKEYESHEITSVQSSMPSGRFSASTASKNKTGVSNMSHDNCRATSSARRFKKPSLLTLGIAAAVLSGGQQAAMAAPELDEIVVTAQKREQRIQDVPIFVSVLSGDQLSEANIMNFSELGKLTPGVAIDGPAGGLGSTIYVRGIGVTKYIEGIRPSVGIFVDDVPLSRIDNAFTNFSDIDRIEVLKGPQATLFGKEVASGKRMVTASFDRPAQQYAVLRAESDAENRAARELADMLKLALAADLSK